MSDDGRRMLLVVERVYAGIHVPRCGVCVSISVSVYIMNECMYVVFMYRAAGCVDESAREQARERERESESESERERERERERE